MVATLLVAGAWTWEDLAEAGLELEDEYWALIAAGMRVFC